MSTERETGQKGVSEFVSKERKEKQREWVVLKRNTDRGNAKDL